MHVLITSGSDGIATSIFTQHARFAETDMRLRRDQDIDTADDGQSRLSTLDRIHTPMDSDQGTRACCLNRFAGSVQVQKIAHATGSYRGDLTGGGRALYDSTCPGEHFTIAATGRAHKQSRVGS